MRLRNKAVNLLKIRVHVRNSSRRAGSKTGIPLKRKEMPICDGFIQAWEDFASRAVRETNPRGLTCAVAVRYKDSGQDKPKRVILLAIYGLQRKSAQFSANLNANCIKDSSYLTCNLSLTDKIDPLFSPCILSQKFVEKFSSKERHNLAHGASRGLRHLPCPPSPLPPARDRGAPQARGGVRAIPPQGCALG